MSEAEARPTNFIRQIIDGGLATSRHATVHTRFPPEPNGYLHIGHAKSIYLNFGVAQDYQDQCNLRFDDINPVREDIEYVESIKNDVQWLGLHRSGDVCYSSDYFDQLRQCAVELINKGLAYVDELSPDEICECRGTLKVPGKNSSYRDRSVGKDLALSGKIHNGGFEEGRAYLRTKTDMTSPFVMMRDPVLYRIRFAEHHQTDSKWCICPMYDFTHCISGALEGITHPLCTLEFQDNHRPHGWMLNNISIPVRPHQYKFSCLNLEYTVTPKRKLNQPVTEKYTEGWDDPYIPAISGLCRRGCTAESIRGFCKHIDATKQDNTIEMVPLEFCIHEDFNENAPCATAVIDPVKLVIRNYPQGKNKVVTIPNHPNKPEMDSHEVPLSAEIWIDRADFHEEADKQYKCLVLGEEACPRNAYMIKTERVERGAKGNITTIFYVYDVDTLSKDPADDHKVRDVAHWVDAAHALPMEICPYDHLFSVLNSGTEGDFLTVISSDSLMIKQGCAEPSPAQAETGRAHQFGHEGYFCLDNRYTNASSLMFNCAVGLCDTWTKVGE